MWVGTLTGKRIFPFALKIEMCSFCWPKSREYPSDASEVAGTREAYLVDGKVKFSLTEKNSKVGL